VSAKIQGICFSEFFTNSEAALLQKTATRANVVPDAGQLPGVGIAASLPARHEVLRQNRTRKPAAAQQHGSRFNVRHYTTVM
jgi:hypothetical protein